MTEDRVLGLLPHLPDGLSEIYFHPAAQRTPPLVTAMPSYRHSDELAALLSLAVRERIDTLGIRRVTYSGLAASSPTEEGRR